MNAFTQRSWWTRRPRPPKRGPVSRMAAPLAPATEGLRLTEWLVLGVFCLAYMMAISAPLFAIPLHRTGLNHVAMALLGPVLLLHLVGLALNREPPRFGAVMAACLPLLLMAAYALVGSAVAKWELQVRDTYLTFGLYTAILPLYAAAVPTLQQRLRHWALALITIWVFFSLAALAGEAARVGTKETLHEIEYLVVSGFFVLYYAVPSRAIKLLAVVMLLVAVALNQKLTGYIIAAMAVLHIVLAAGWRRLLPQWRWPYVVGAAVFTAAVAAVLTLLFFEFREYLPTGNVDVRLKQYEAAMRQFIESPLWGTAYTAGSGEAYRESVRLLNIPTHSDVLDMLKHGGLIGFGLFCWGYWKIFALINRAVSATRGDALLNAYFVGVRFFQLAALFNFSVNPLLLKGPFLIVIWGNLGLAVGMALAATGAFASDRAGQPGRPAAAA